MLHDVRQWPALIPMAIASAAVETLGAGAIFALVAIIGNPGRAAASAIYSCMPWH